jgi:hypothetical protein
MASPSPLRSSFARIPILALVLALACSEDAAKQTAEQAANRAADKAREVGEQAAGQAKHKAGELGDQAKHKAGELASELGDQAKHKAGELWAERPPAGELSERAKGMLAKGASASSGGVEALLAKGVQIAPTAFEIAKILGDAVEGDVAIEPIVQKLDNEAAQAELDARIKDMPRVETIHGLDVGFKDVTQWDPSGRETQSAYLILWRSDSRLLGLVYRSRKRVKLDSLVADAPRLISLVSGVL